MSTQKAIILLFCLIALIILFSGCINLDKTAVSTVKIAIDETGNITKYDVKITMSANTYDQLKSYASSQGYTSVREYFLRDFKGSDAYLKYNEELDRSDKEISLKNLVIIDSHHRMNPISINIVDNKLYFNDTTFSGDYFIPIKFIKELDYSVSVPVKIEISNANSYSKDEFTAYWEYKNDQTIPEQYLITHVASPENLKSPGFEIILPILAIGFVILACSKKT